MAKRRVGTTRTPQGEAKPAARAPGRGGVGSPPPGGDCVYAGQAYSEGAIIDEGGVQQRCVNGKWQIVDPAHRGRPGAPNG